jgi:hypothetical protein
MNVNIATVTNAPPLLASHVCIDKMVMVARQYRVYNSNLADNGSDLKMQLEEGDFAKAKGIIQKIYEELSYKSIPSNIQGQMTRNHEYLLGLIDRAQQNRKDYSRN